MKVGGKRKKRKTNKARDEKERKRSVEPQPVRIGKASGLRDVDGRNYGDRTVASSYRKGSGYDK